MYLNKEEMEVLYWVLMDDLMHSYRVYIYSTKDAKNQAERRLEIEREIFRRIKRKLGKKIMEGQALLMGIAEEVSEETLQECIKIDSNKPLRFRRPEAIMAWVLQTKRNR